MGNLFSNEGNKISYESSAEASLYGDKVYCKASGNAHASVTQTSTTKRGEERTLTAEADAPGEESFAEVNVSFEKGRPEGKVRNKYGSASAEAISVDKYGETKSIVLQS